MELLPSSESSTTGIVRRPTVRIGVGSLGSGLPVQSPPQDEVFLVLQIELHPVSIPIITMVQYKAGQRVRYKPIGRRSFDTSESTGVIKGVLTEPGMQAGRHVDASNHTPRYEIENSNTGKRSSVYEDNILGTVS
ncbi:hypothetical protein DL766_005150 [Monosporascus sp. MC13-8B]|uniref:Hypervirulence associated protein TUDOR domain-containing protein n=1 Tax=Monosporascus cannonballus TaxID=155416 RepID=A0ABY0HIN3_9PEZI|nr:hypothetical protein DL762_000634 [Monosporascus cannonballus]RYP01421.1 hypothetical protein DL763_000231 [Monosporascus cannonballus]RYP29851.1 hypothetical protein DL766_005150 [Monosporascus sp. MC13-8B]